MIIGLEQIKVIAAIAARGDSNILIQGETGTGKELLARYIHDCSPRKDMPYIAVNCAALQDSLIESELFGHVRGAYTGAEKYRQGKFGTANGGTLLLDEIGEMKPEFQAKLLRVLQNGEYYPLGDDSPHKSTARIVATTNKNLDEAMEFGQFRKDLYYRLAVITMTIPPLRERRQEIQPLVEHYGGKQLAKPETIKKLMAYQWPGNVRELKNHVEYFKIMGKWPVSHKAAIGTKELRDKELYLKTLKQCDWNKTLAASILGVSQRTVRNKLKKWGIHDTQN